MDTRSPRPALHDPKNPDAPPIRIDLGDGEELIMTLSPHWIYILLDRWGVLLAACFAAAMGYWLVDGFEGAPFLLIPVFWLGWQLIERASRRYVLTDRRVVMTAGVLRQIVVDAPLANVRQVSLYRSLPERLLGLGTVMFATAGTGGQDLVWRVLDRPADVLRVARDALDQTGDPA